MSAPLGRCPVCGEGDAFERGNCRRCGVRVEVGAADPEAVAAANRSYYDAAPETAELPRARRPLYEAVLRRLEWLMPGKGRLLDVGCGGGEFLKMAAERGWEGAGLEHAPRLLAEARRRLPGVPLEPAWDRLSLKDDSIAAAVFLDILDETLEPARLLARARRALRPGGVVFVRVRNGVFQRRLRRLTRAAGWLFRGWTQTELYTTHPLDFSPRALRRLLRNGGFDAVRVGNSPLTAGDPYGSFRIPGLGGLLKRGFLAAAKAVEWVFLGSVLIGPSLWAWGRKPS